MESLTFTLKTFRGKTLQEEVFLVSTVQDALQKAQALLKEDESETSYCVMIKSDKEKVAVVKYGTIPFRLRVVSCDTRKNNEDLAITPYLFTPFARVKRIGTLLFGIGVCWLYFGIAISFDFNYPSRKGLKVKLFSKLS